jgi:sodium/hydrogen exchanger-like protein 3
VHAFNISICQSKFFRFKRFDNRFIHPYLLRNYQGAEPKILETYSKLAMKDAMEYMRRIVSTVGNISGTESMSAVFRHYTTGNINGNLSGTLNGRLVVLHSPMA